MLIVIVAWPWVGEDIGRHDNLGSSWKHCIRTFQQLNPVIARENAIIGELR